MDLKQIRYLVAVADAGSLSGGAKRAFITQPTLSVAIAALEKELGAKLFERWARGVELTSEGRRAVEYARTILRDAEKMKSVGLSADTKPLRIGLLPTLSPQLIVQTIARLQQFDPNCKLRMEDAALRVLSRRLANGRYDAILTLQGKSESGHRRAKIADDRLCLAFAKAAKPAGQITPEVLHDRPLIVRTHCEFLASASRILDDWKVRPRIIAKTESDERALELVAAGLGACLMPNSMQHPGVVFVKPEGVDIKRRIGLKWIKGAADGWFERMAGEIF